MEIWKYPRLLHSPNPAFHKGGIFFKNCCNRGWEIFTGNGGGSQEWGVGFIIGDGKSIYIVGRGVLTPLFYEDSPVYIYFP